MSDYISPEALRQQMESDPPPVVIDVRGDDEYAAGHIPGALHMPAGEVEERLDELPRGRPIVPY